jgi:hypothetical protein
LNNAIDFSIEFLVKTYQNKWVVSTTRVAIVGQESLEGVLREGTGWGGVVLCHPHPLYGGSMDNNVVEAMEEAFSLIGFSTVRFNFRGVGSSTGAYDGGEGEVEDVLAACRFMRERGRADERLVLAGYSFGAWVSARAASRIEGPVDLFLVAYPFSVYGSDALRSFRGPIRFVGGSLDEISPLDDLMALYKELKTDKSLRVIPASHFFEGREEEIADFIREIFGPGTGGPSCP